MNKSPRRSPHGGGHMSWNDWPHVRGTGGQVPWNTQVKDRGAPLTFYDYPAEHWNTSGRRTRPLVHVNMPCPAIIESTFATVRHRTKRTEGCLSRETGLALLGDASITCQAVHGVQADDPSRDIAAQCLARQWSAQKKWRKRDGQNRLPEIIQGIEFRDGIRQLQAAARSSVTTFCAYFDSDAVRIEWWTTTLICRS